jgi:NTE family protein
MENIDLTDSGQAADVRPTRIGLVLSGGGVAGYAFHVAVLAALEAATGFDARTAEVMVGTSAGAIAGAAIRGDVPPRLLELELLTGLDDTEEDSVWQVVGPVPRVLPRLWTGPGAPAMALRELARGHRMRPMQFLAALLPEGRSSLSPLVEPINRLHPQGWPDRPLWIPITDRSSGERVVAGRDPEVTEQAAVADAVLASAALPMYFAPVAIGDRHFLDGGLGSPFNADLLAPDPTATAIDPMLDFDLVIVSAPLSIDRIDAGSPLASTARGVPRRRLNSEIKQIEDGGTETLVIEPDRAMADAMGLNPMDHGRIPAIAAEATGLVERLLATAPSAAIAFLRQAGRTLASPPDVAYPPAEGR